MNRIPAAGSRLFVFGVLPLLWAAAYLPNLHLRSLRLEEGRRAAPARTMLETGNFTTPKLYGDVYLSKPPLYFWLTAATGAAQGGVDELSCRLPAAVGALLSAWVVWFFGRRTLDPVARATAAVLVLGGPVMLDKGTLGEIETVFCVTVVGAWAAWWNGRGADGRVAPGAWLWVGVWLALAMLLKGPPGVALFVIPVAVFVVWQREWRGLLSPWAGAAAVIAAVPMVLWLRGLESDPTVDMARAREWWGRQMGVTEPTTWPDYVAHFFQLFADAGRMLLPWGLAAVPVMVPPLARRIGVPDDLRRFVTAGLVGLTVFMAFWPIARARHMMPAWHLACIAAGVAAVHLPRLGPVGPGPVLVRIGTWLAAVSMPITALVVLIATMVTGLGTPAFAGAALVVAVPAAVLIVRAVQQSDEAAQLGLALRAGAAAMAVGWGLVYGLLLRPKLDREGARHEAAALLRVIDEELPLRTVLTFPVRGEMHYNRQFYFGDRLRALHDAGDLPVGERTTVLMEPSDVAAYSDPARFRMRVLNPVALPDGPLVAVEVTRLR